MKIESKAKLKPGKFYWVLITLDPDAEDWENELMPARFVRYDEHGEYGKEIWNFIGCEGESSWPGRWIGEELVPPKL